ncbi:MAG: ATP-binding cassette domain-containing protein [Saprospiraceae bacterium]|nr:ATP-binding cassette domain-containing protein [Saprospiraceae bacterium]MBK7810155.1 ATP-binding cassette domain-containing protein [Saprospiraceae bacterium]MBK9629759.1 ATP-binding cassette domain-containing protein [Saprospiraceae bacterium]
MKGLLTLDRVIKDYDQLRAVDQISFEVPDSCIFGLLGPNGAGKTSLIRIITGITRADSGTVFLQGQPINTLQNPSIGYMPEERGLYKKMKVGEQLIYLCRLKGKSAAEAKQSVTNWMERFEIMSWWNKKVEELSKGMSQKVQFIATVVHDPSLIILDEPFSGLDPINSNLIKDVIIDLKNKGAAILFSTHRMEQVEELCEQIVLINKGKAVLQGLVKEIRHQFKEHLFELVMNPSEGISWDGYADLLSTQNDVSIIRLAENRKSNEILQHIISQNIDIVSFKEIYPTFNDIFIRTVNESNHE